jgi:hypothetical protein
MTISNDVIAKVLNRLRHSDWVEAAEKRSKEVDAYRVGRERGIDWASTTATWLELHEVARWSASDADYLAHLALIDTVFAPEGCRGFAKGFLEAIGEVYAALISAR